MKFVLSVICIFIFLTTNAQQITIKGKITDNNSKAIPYANIYTKKTGTISNENGLFTLKINKYDTVCISSLGYKQKIFSPGKLQTDKLNKISLTPYYFKLNQVNIKDFSPKTIAKLIIKAKNKLYKNSKQKSKTFVRINSYKSKQLTEHYEGYYNSIINKITIDKISFKNATYFYNKANYNLQSLNFASFFPLYTYILHKPAYKNNYNLIPQYAFYHQQTKTPEIIFNTPLLYNSVKKIIKLFSFETKEINDSVLFISFRGKKIGDKGEITINLKNLNILELSFVKKYSKKFPIEIVNSNKKITSLSITYQVSNNTNNTPVFIKYNLNYLYSGNYATDTIHTSVFYHNYSIGKHFNSPKYNLKTQFEKSDYNLTYITPFNIKIWENENNIQRTTDEIDFLKKNTSIKIDKYINKKLKIILWHKNYSVDTSLVKIIKNVDSYILGISTSIYYDIYQTNDSSYITTCALLDYNKTFFSFNPDTNFIKEIFDLTKTYADKLKIKLQKSRIKNHNSIYNQINRDFINERNLLIKQYLKNISTNSIYR